MERLLKLLRDVHLTYPAASTVEIEEFERRVGWRLDDDLRQFYLSTNGARLFSKINCPFHILPLQEIMRTRVAVFGVDLESRGPPNWWALVDVQDGNYLAVDILCIHEGRYGIRDIFHETATDPEYCRVIAPRFGDFLQRALHSDGAQYWLSESPDDSPQLW
jgi:cell wall assembly regulator SMI1